MPKLDAATIEEFFSDHLPYRIRAMMAHCELKTCESQSRMDACFIGSVVTGRVLLNALGIGKKNNELSRFEPREDDVMIADLGGILVNPDSLSTHDKDLLFNFLIMADKAGAHFTSPREHNWKQTDTALNLILTLLVENLYRPTGRRFPRLNARRQPTN